MKKMLYLMAVRSVTLECEWVRIYQRLLPRMGTYDERMKDYRSKKRIFGRITGQRASMAYALLKTDQETLSKVSPGEAPPPHMLYDPEAHRRHQEGHYRSLKPGTQARRFFNCRGRCDRLLQRSRAIRSPNVSLSNVIPLASVLQRLPQPAPRPLAVGVGCFARSRSCQGPAVGERNGGGTLV
jgi:hypothetical protein